MKARDANRLLARQRHLPPDSEAELHAQIIDECRRHDWYVVHERIGKHSQHAAGTPDFVIALPSARTLWVECKVGKKKLSPEQQSVGNWLTRDDHEFYTVRSLFEFRQAAKPKLNKHWQIP